MQPDQRADERACCAGSRGRLDGDGAAGCGRFSTSFASVSCCCVVACACRTPLEPLLRESS